MAVLMPVRFWDRDVDSRRHAFVEAPTWTGDPENAPDAEYTRLPEDFDEARDQMLVGEDIYDGDWWNEPVRHPSRTLLSKLAAASYPAASTGTPAGLEHGVPAPEGSPPSSGLPGRPSSRNEVQPGRGHDRAA